MTTTLNNENTTTGRGDNRRPIAEMRAIQAVDMKIRRSLSYAQIGQELGISASTAQAAYRRGVLLLVPKDELDEYKQAALQKLDVWEQMVLEVYHAEHVLVNFGKVVIDENGNRMLDAAPKLQAVDRLVKIERERRAIVGYSAPSKRVLEVVTEDVFERAIRQLNEDAARLERETERAERNAGTAALLNQPELLDAAEPGEPAEV